jgi:nitrite reductase/ring-hydroxylating ferredoxin subunit
VTEPFELHRAGEYRRQVRASLARVWENVFDWEHLPALHARDFESVALHESGEWGWRGEITLPGGRRQALQMIADKPAGSYVVTTLEGVGAGTEIRTRLTERARHRTDVHVEFFAPIADPARLKMIGDAYVAVYTRLWDEDEAMMLAREAALRRRRTKPAPLVLGAEADIRARLPMHVEFGGSPFRIVEIDGRLHAHALTCPHWLGPLDAPLDGTVVRCPWHGYTFDVCTGKSADGRGLALQAPPRVEISDGSVRLLPASA